MWKAEGSEQTLEAPIRLKRPFNNEDTAGFDAWVLAKHEKQQREDRLEKKQLERQQEQEDLKQEEEQKGEGETAVGATRQKSESASLGLSRNGKGKKKKSRKASQRRLRKHSTGDPYKESPRFKQQGEQQGGVCILGAYCDSGERCGTRVTRQLSSGLPAKGSGSKGRKRNRKVSKNKLPTLKLSSTSKSETGDSTSSHASSRMHAREDSIASARMQVKEESSDIIAARSGSMTHREPLKSSSQSSVVAGHPKPVKPPQQQSRPTFRASHPGRKTTGGPASAKDNANVTKTKDTKAKGKGAKRARDQIIKKLSTEIFALKNTFNEYHQEVMHKRAYLDQLEAVAEKNEARCVVPESPTRGAQGSSSSPSSSASKSLSSPLASRAAETELAKKRKVGAAWVNLVVALRKDTKTGATEMEVDVDKGANSILHWHSQKEWKERKEGNPNNRAKTPPQLKGYRHKEISYLRGAVKAFEVGGGAPKKIAKSFKKIIERTIERTDWDYETLMSEHLPEEVFVLDWMEQVKVEGEVLRMMLNRSIGLAQTDQTRVNIWKSKLKARRHDLRILEESYAKEQRLSKELAKKLKKWETEVTRRRTHYERELEKQRSELEEMQKWARIEEEIFARRETMRAEIRGEMKKEELKKHAQAKEVELQIQKSFSITDRLQLEPYKQAAEKIFRATGIGNTEVMVENFANLDTRTESMRSSFEDAKKTKMLSEKRLEDLNHKAKHIRLNGVDFNDDLSKRLDQVESEQDELRPTLKNSKALCRKSLTAMMKVRDGISNLAILLGEDRNVVKVDKHDGLPDVLDRFAQRIYEILNAVGNPVGKSVAGAANIDSAGVIGVGGLDLGSLDGCDDRSNTADGGDGVFIGSHGGSRGADKFGLISENDDLPLLSSSLVRSTTLSRSKVTEIAGSAANKVQSRVDVRDRLLRKVRAVEISDTVVPKLLGPYNNRVLLPTSSTMPLKRRFTEMPAGSTPISGESLPLSPLPQEVYGIKGANARFVVDNEDEDEDWVNEEEEEMEEHKLRRRSTKNLSFSLEKKHSARKKAFKNAAKFRANLSGNAKKQAERKRQLAKELRRREKAAAIAEKKARRAGVHKGAERQRKAELARQRRKKKEGSF